MALGLKGGFALAESGMTAEVSVSLGLALLLAVLVPAMGYLLLRRWLSGFDAAAIAATYGSVSAVTFITAVQHLDSHGVAFGGHMAAAMALMESPAIIMAVLLANLVRRKQQGSSASTASPGPLSKVLHEALTDGAQLLLIGAMLVGLMTGEAGEAAMKPFAGDLFKGMLAFFLLDMGLLAARHMGGLRQQPPLLIVYALGAPLVHAGIALGLSVLCGLSAGKRRPADGAGGQRLLHRRPGGVAPRHPRGQPGALLWHVAGADVSLQHPVRAFRCTQAWPSECWAEGL